MEEFVKKLSAALGDPRVIVGICGIVLSVVMHELFHIIMHLGEIRSIHIFPDTQAIVEILLVPSPYHDLVVEEAIAYIITMTTLILTAILVGDIHDARSTKSVRQTLFTEDFTHILTETDEQKTLDYLATLLGVTTAAGEIAPNIAGK